MKIGVLWLHSDLFSVSLVSSVFTLKRLLLLKKQSWCAKVMQYTMQCVRISTPIIYPIFTKISIRSFITFSTFYYQWDPVFASLFKSNQIVRCFLTPGVFWACYLGSIAVADQASILHQLLLLLLLLLLLFPPPPPAPKVIVRKDNRTVVLLIQTAFL